MARRASKRSRRVAFQTLGFADVSRNAGREVGFASGLPLPRRRASALAWAGRPRSTAVRPTLLRRRDPALFSFRGMDAALRATARQLRSAPSLLSVRKLLSSVAVARRLESLDRLKARPLKAVDRCAARRQRSQVLFAQGVAGRRWSSGGPSMRGARRTVESSYSCGG